MAYTLVQALDMLTINLVLRFSDREIGGISITWSCKSLFEVRFEVCVSHLCVRLVGYRCPKFICTSPSVTFKLIQALNHQNTMAVCEDTKCQLYAIYACMALCLHGSMPLQTMLQPRSMCISHRGRAMLTSSRAKNSSPVNNGMTHNMLIWKP